MILYIWLLLFYLYLIRCAFLLLCKLVHLSCRRCLLNLIMHCELFLDVLRLQRLIEVVLSLSVLP